MIQGVLVLKNSDVSLIDCEVFLNDQDKEALRHALSCYETYRETIEKSGIVNMIGDKVYFEIFDEDHKPMLADLTRGI